MSQPPCQHILAACSPGEVRVAVTGPGLRDFVIWHPGHPDGVGDVHRGRLIARAPALGGSFVALEAAADGFLPDSEVAGPVTEGMLLAVRIARAAQGGKGPRLVASGDAAAAQGGVRRVRRGAGPLVELAGGNAQAAVLVDDAGVAAGLRAGLGARVQMVAAAFDAALMDQVAALEGEAVALDGGGRMRVQPTAALTAIDIDMAAATSGGGRKTGAHAAFNLALLPQVAAQIRLRNLSGAILVDFAGLSTRRRVALGPALQALLATDPVAARLVGFTGLGLAEIVRQRIRAPLHEVLAGAPAVMAAALRAAVAAARPGVAAVLSVAPDLLACYEADGVMRGDLARSAAHALILQADPTLPGGTWRLRPPP